MSSSRRGFFGRLAGVFVGAAVATKALPAAPVAPLPANQRAMSRDDETGISIRYIREWDPLALPPWMIRQELIAYYGWQYRGFDWKVDGRGLPVQDTLGDRCTGLLVSETLTREQFKERYPDAAILPRPRTLFNPLRPIPRFHPQAFTWNSDEQRKRNYEASAFADELLMLAKNPPWIGPRR